MAKKIQTRMAGAASSADPAISAPTRHTDATLTYTARFAERYEPDFYRGGIAAATVSSFGIGTYLGECTEQDDRDYVDAISTAIESGVNLVDTAINYRCQRSERAVGAAVRRVVEAGTPRDAIIVCTKGGYLPLEDRPPASRDQYRAYLKQEFFTPGILTPDDVVGGGHSMSPSFIRYAIARSRKNLGLERIDLYYLHNPEQQLGQVPPASFRERLRAAFMVLEDAVDRGEIRAYGCATWNAFRVPPTSKGHLSIAELVGIAREVGGEAHHLTTVQMPINLGMPEAVRLPTQVIGTSDALVPALEAASSLGLAVVASASLMQAQLTRDLPASVRELFPRQHTDAQRALAFVRTLPGVTSALVGTRSVQHVAENLASAERTPSTVRK